MAPHGIDDRPTPERSPLAAPGTRGDAARRRSIRAILIGAAILSLAISLSIVVALVEQAFLFLSKVRALVALERDAGLPGAGDFDIPTLLIGTLWSR